MLVGPHRGCRVGASRPHLRRSQERWCIVAGAVQPPAGTSSDAIAVYSLGSSKVESDRLLRQADELSVDSAALLDRVAPGGRVVGVDANPAHAAMAAEFAARQGLPGVEIVTADARHTGLPSGSF